MNRLRSLLVFAALAVLVAMPAAAQRYAYGDNYENQLRFGVGTLEPRGDGRYWQDVESTFDGSAKDLRSGTLGVDYLHQIAPQLWLLVGGEFFSGDSDFAYRDFVDQSGRDIIHTTSLDTSTLNVGLELDLAPRRSPVVPYIGAGGSAIAYRLREHGDFVDFSGPNLHVFGDRFKDDGVGYGWFATAGLDIRLNRGFGIYAEGRWQRADVDLRGDFRGSGSLDLSSTAVKAGVSWRF